jgi:predicted  nucleic acid-binding Zn-ribbon protein
VEQWQRQFPELKLEAEGMLQRLAQARGQLREHLGELHQYLSQSRSEQESVFQSLAEQAERVRRQQHELARAREEHRLAITAFRQQISEWSGQLAALRQHLTTGETRLEFRQARLEQQEKSLQETSTKLASQAETLNDQQRAVSQQRSELDRHLHDMRAWVRQKMRDLSERQVVDDNSRPSEGTILRFQGEVTEADQQLGTLLTRLALVDLSTLNTLFGEARRQDLPLRDLLVRGEYLSQFQLEQIEVGKFDKLAVGPLRIVDRLHSTSTETIYRVFDSRHKEDALLRHLHPSESDERKAEYRVSFGRAATVSSPYLATTREVLEWNGSPAALQEWIDGVPSTEWAEFASVPSVWLRILQQAITALRATHEAGLAHGHLLTGRVLLTDMGTLKLCGLGEPDWLFAPRPEASASVAELQHHDVRSLVKIAAGWLSGGTAIPRISRRGVEPLKELLRPLLDPQRNCSLDELTQMLTEAGERVVADEGAWERLLVFLRERLLPEIPPRHAA